MQWSDLELLLSSRRVPVVALKRHVHLLRGHSVHGLHDLTGQRQSFTSRRQMTSVSMETTNETRHLSDEAVPRVGRVRGLLSAPLSAVVGLVQLRGGARHMVQLDQVGDGGDLRRLRLRLRLHDGGHDHVHRPHGTGDRVAPSPPLGLHVYTFEVGGRRPLRRAGAGLAEAAWVVLHHHAVSGNRRMYESAVLIHSGRRRVLRARSGSAHN